MNELGHRTVKGFRKLKVQRQLPVLRATLLAHQAKYSGNTALDEHAIAA